MTDLSADAARTLELLRDAGGPLSYEELAEGGVRWPGDAVYELQLVGEPITDNGPATGSSAASADRVPLLRWGHPRPLRAR